MHRFAPLLLFVALAARAGTIHYELPEYRLVNDIAFAPDGRLLIATWSELLALDASGRATTIDPDASLTSLAVASDGAVWGHDGERVVRIGSDIAFTAPGWIQSFGAGHDGAIWLIASDGSLRSLVRLDANGHVLTSVPLPPGERFWRELVAAGGAVWAVDLERLVKLGPDGAADEFPLPLPNARWFLSGGDVLWLANDPQVSDDPRQIVRVDASGAVTARYPSPVRSLVGAATDAAGNLWLSDEWDYRIVRMTPAGETTTVTAIVWRGDAYDEQPMAVAADGRIAVAKNDPGFFPIPMRSAVFIVDPASPHEIPALSRAALLVMTITLAAAGTVLFRHRL